MKQSIIALAAVLFPSLVLATTADFDDVGTVGSEAPDIVADGVTVSFSNLEIAEVGGTTNGFGGSAGPNQVVLADRQNFSGRFLTAAGFGQALVRTPGFVRTILFDTPVVNVSLYVADIDAGDGIVASAYDESGNLLRSFVFPNSTGRDGRVTLIDFGEVPPISEVTLVGTDPIGIDNLSFTRNVVSVTVDVKPGSDDNCGGVIPIAILGSEALDVSQIDPNTLSFEELNIRQRGNGELSCGIEDVNFDGYMDYVCQYENGFTEGHLSGSLVDGTEIIGSDLFCVKN